jgi:hypothetical protein
MGATSLRLLAVLALGVVALGCGKVAPAPTGGGVSSLLAPGAQGVLSVTTKNTTRLGGADPATDAAAVARAVYPGLTPASRPQAVVLVDERNWPASLVASALASAPLGAPLLYADGDSLPAATVRALRAMRPVGASALGGTQVIRIATSAPVPDGYRTRTLPSAGPPGADRSASLAAAVEALLAVADGGAPRQVIVLAADAPLALQMPAAGLSAESGAPILPLTQAAVPSATTETLRSLHRPAIYVLGASALPASTLAELAQLGRLRPVAGTGGAGVSPGAGDSGSSVLNAIAVSRFADGSFGWGIHEAGHGLVFASGSRPLDGPAAAPLSAHGDYGPLLLLDRNASLPQALARYLSDIEPGYTEAIRPVRAVYNHGWLIGDERAISALAQAEIDSVLEIVPRKASTEEPSVSPPE